MQDLALYAVVGSDLHPLPVPPRARDVHALFEGLPDGIYSALRSYPGHRFLRLEAHLERCRRCVTRAAWQANFEYDGLRHALDQAVRAHGKEVRARFDLFETPLDGAVPGARVVLGISPHEPIPPDLLAEGVRLGLAPEGLERSEPLIKYTEWVTRRTVCKDADPGAYEHLLLDTDGRILEGTSSNFFAVRGQSLITAGDGVLEGITGQLVVELAEKRGLHVELRRPTLDEVRQSDEAFITSSTREVVPVTAVTDFAIGNGAVGPIVTALATDYSAYAAANARPAVE